MRVGRAMVWKTTQERFLYSVVVIVVPLTFLGGSFFQEAAINRRVGSGQCKRFKEANPSLSFVATFVFVILRQAHVFEIHGYFFSWHHHVGVVGEN